VDGLVSAIVDQQVDGVIIAGDVANDYVLTLSTLRNIETVTGRRCLFVPGNHDIWNEHHPHQDAWQIYEGLRQFQGNLANGPIKLRGHWVVIGDLGWYDYSFGSTEFAVRDFDRMKIDNRLWEDKVKAVWGKPTLEIHRYFYDKLERQLKAYQGQDIIFVTHVLPHRFFTVQQPNRHWRYLNAFLGSRQYGELALRYSVRYAICGHVHYRKEMALHQTKFICNCLNYSDQWLNDDPTQEIANIFKVIEID
jgi:putative phosphoesterase